MQCKSENSRDCFSFYPEFTNALAIQPHPTHNVSHSTERWMEHSRQTWVLPSSWDVNTIVFLMESGEKERRVMKNSFPVSANWQENFNIKHMNACFVDCKHKLLFLWWNFFFTLQLTCKFLHSSCLSWFARAKVTCFSDVQWNVSTLPTFLFLRLQCCTSRFSQRQRLALKTFLNKRQMLLQMRKVCGWRGEWCMSTSPWWFSVVQTDLRAN